MAFAEVAAGFAREAPVVPLAFEEGEPDFAAPVAFVVFEDVLAAALLVFVVLAPEAVCDPEADFVLEAAVFLEEAPAALVFAGALGLLMTDVLTAS